MSFVSKHVLPCTFVLMALCIYELSLFPMHSYHCRRNLEIYVIVVNISSTLSWMISEWFCWSWDMHRLMPIYFPTLLFYCFCLKSSPNVNLQMKRDFEMQKPVAHTSIWQGKRKSDQKIQCMMPKKPKTCSSNWNIKNFKYRSQNEMYWFKKMKWYDVYGAKWNASKLWLSSFCRRSYIHISIIEIGHII